MQLLPTQEEVVALLRDAGALRSGHFEYPDKCTRMNTCTDPPRLPALSERAQHSASALAACSAPTRNSAPTSPSSPSLLLPPAICPSPSVYAKPCAPIRFIGRAARWRRRQADHRFRQFLSPERANRSSSLTISSARATNSLNSARSSKKPAPKCSRRHHLPAQPPHQEFRQLAPLPFGQTGNRLLRRRCQLRPLPPR